jgi:hypothetical protein
MPCVHRNTGRFLWCIANVLYLQAWLTLATVPGTVDSVTRIAAATRLYEQAYALRAGVNCAISPREQAAYDRLADALNAVRD